MCYVQYVRWRKSEKWVRMSYSHCENPVEWRGCCASSVLSILSSIPFWKCKLSLKGRRCGDISTVQEQSAIVCSQTVEKMVNIFVRDRSLKECPLCRSQCGCWSATSIETSVYDMIYIHLECSWAWWPCKERSLIMWCFWSITSAVRTHEVEPTHCYVDGSAPC